MLKYLKNVFFTIPICLLSATVISIILKYIWVLLKISPPLQIYKQLFNCSNLTYIVSPIRKIRFKDLDFFIPSGDVIDEILKIIIFIDKIDNAIQIAKYLQSRFSECIWKKKRSNHIIHIFTANFTTTSRTKFLADLYLDETQIWIYTKCASMGINLLNICRAIKFKIFDYIILPEFLQ